jgi:hypothetical protein
MLLRCESLEPPMSQLGMNGPKATSALSPFDSQLRTLVGAARRSHSCHNRTHALQQARLYSIASSAASRRPDGTSRPRALAVCRLMTNSNLVDWVTGSSAGFAPFRIVRNIGTVAHQAAHFDKGALGISRGNPISCRQGGKLHTTAAEEGVGATNSPARSIWGEVERSQTTRRMSRAASASRWCDTDSRTESALT